MESEEDDKNCLSAFHFRMHYMCGDVCARDATPLLPLPLDGESSRAKHELDARKEECFECIIRMCNMEKYCYFIFTELGAVAAFDIMMIIAILRQIFWIGVVER